MAEQPPGHDYRVPVPPGVKTQLQHIGDVIGRALPEGWGFALLIFTTGDNHDEHGQPTGTMTYISSAQRADMVKAMEEFIRAQANA